MHVYSAYIRHVGIREYYETGKCSNNLSMDRQHHPIRSNSASHHSICKTGQWYCEMLFPATAEADYIKDSDVL